MKKLLLLIMSLSMVTIACSACDWFRTPEDSSSITSSDKEEKTYKVTFMQDDKVVKVVEVKEGDAVDEKDVPAVTPKTGYTIVWQDVDLSNIFADTVVKTVAKANTYTVTYTYNDGTEAYSEKVTYDSNVTLPTPEREGFTFLGWEKDGVIINGGKWTYAEDVTLIARWVEATATTCTITFQNSAGVVLHTREVAEGESLTDIPAYPTDSGYTYSWSETDFTNITENMTVTLNAVANTYTITYDVNCGTLVSGSLTQEVTYNASYELDFPEVTRDDYTLVEWEGMSSLPVNVWNVAGNATLIAVWEPAKPNTYTVKFVNENGTLIKQVTVEEGGSIEQTNIPAFPGDPGYEYSWSETDFTNITEDMTVTLNAVAKPYTITYDANGGTFVSGNATQAVIYKAAYELELPQVSKASYNFVRWELVGAEELPEGVWTIASNVTMQAVWEKKATYTVTFVQSGQALKAYENVEEGTNFTEIPAVVGKTGYKVEWDSADLALLKNVQQNVEVYAIEIPNVYKVTYSDAKGVFSGTVDVTYDGEYNLMDALDQDKIPTGYSFGKFKLENGEAITASGDEWKIAGNVTVSVEWTPNEYTVMFNANGGTCSETRITVTYGTAYVLPKATDKDGYTFLGWKLNGTRIPNEGTWTYTAAGTIELVAEWRSDEWTNNY